MDTERLYVGYHSVLRFKSNEYKLTNLSPRSSQDALSCQTNSQVLTLGTVHHVVEWTLSTQY